MLNEKTIIRSTITHYVQEGISGEEAMKNVKSLIAFLSAISILSPLTSLAQCADCDVDLDKRELRRIEDWNETRHLRRKPAELDDAKQRLEGDRVAQEIVDERQKDVVPKTE